LKISNVQAHTYSNLLPVFSSVLGTIQVPRSYIAADVSLRGTAFRFITTHLETYDALTNDAQGEELIGGPANTMMPVVAVGDFNSSANGETDTSDTYPALLSAGFDDIWQDLHPRLVGNTCCQAEDLSNFTSQLYERLDLVMVKDGVSPLESHLVNLRFFTQPYWPSDHAGLEALLLIGGPQSH